jgi:DNA-binding response OmpR family regulator
MQGDREKCMEAGCDDLIPKPVERESFIAVCRKWMKSSEPGAVLPSNREVGDPTLEPSDREQR